MSFNSLPAELQLHIFGFLRGRDLKAARAVSRKLRDSASPALFRSVVTGARCRLLQSLQFTAAQPILQKYVNEIVFDGSSYDGTLAKSQSPYENKSIELYGKSTFWGIRTRYTPSQQSISCTCQLTLPRFKRYQDLFREQEDMKVDGVLLQTIARAFEWTTNVSSIVYSPHAHLIPLEAKDVRDLVPPGVSHAPSFQLINSISSTSARFTHTSHAFLHFIGAIHLAQYSGIRELRIEGLEEDMPGTEFAISLFDFSLKDELGAPVPNSTDQGVLRAGRHLFEKLERCELNILLWSPDNILADKIDHLQEFLAVTDGLRHLALHLRHPPHVFSQLGHPLRLGLFHRLGLEKDWTKLRSLSLEGIYAKQEQLMDLIDRHRYTLESLCFRKCTLNTGAWAEIVDEVVYSTRIFPFTLDQVTDPGIPISPGMTQSAGDVDEGGYEGRIELAEDGERNFVKVPTVTIEQTLTRTGGY
jgi:hypothetical protein